MNYARLRKFLSATALVVSSIALTLALMELIMPHLNDFSLEEAVYQVRRPVVQYIYGRFDPQLRYTLKKNLRDIRLLFPGKLDYTVSTNNEGFRGPEWDRSPTKRNIVLLGDSFGFGWGVAWDKTVGELLEKRLQAKDPRFQVINLAIPGYSIKEVVRSLEIYGKPFQPEAVIYLFCPNDTESRTPPLGPGVYELAYHPGPKDAAVFADMLKHNQPGYWTWDKFRRGSYLHAFYGRYVRPIFSRRIRHSLHHDQPPPGFDYPPPLPPDTAPPVTEENRFLDYCLDRLGKDVAGKLYIITASDKTILVRKDAADNLRWVLASYCRRHDKATFVDFESFVRRAPDGHKYYLKYDDHWSQAGHLAAADLLMPPLERDLNLSR